MVKRIALIGLLFLYLITGWCQPADQLASLANAYFKAWPQPNLMLVFNQSKYIPGDTVYFKAFYRVDPIGTSFPDELVNVNLIGFNSESITQVIFPIRNGTGYSQLILPDTLPAGLYLITAQTNWMRNFNKLFTQVVPVVTDKQVRSTASEKVLLRAEGGKLIANIPNRIGISTDYGKRMFEIVDEKDRVVASSITSHWGTAQVTLTPAQAPYYFRWINDTNLQSLPAAVPEGISLQLNQIDNLIKVSINFSRNISSQPLTILITGRGKVHYVNQLEASDDSRTLSISTEKFPPGIMQISILNRSGILLANRDFYIPQSYDVKISVSKQHVKPREDIVVKVNESETPTRHAWLLRATNQQVLPTTKWPHLSWIKNGFASPFPVDSISLQCIDQWLVTASEELPWEKIQYPDKSRKRYPSLNIIERAGFIKDALTGLPVPSGTQIMFLLQQKKFTYQTFTSNSDGFVSLTIPDLIGIDEFFYVAEYKGKRLTVRIEWIEPQTSWPMPPKFSLSDSTDAYAAFKQHVKRINHSYQTFLIQPVRDTIPKPDIIETWLGRSDRKVVADKFIAFASMEEFVREVIPSLSLGTNRSGTWVRVGLSARQATEDPLYIIDGRATLRTDLFLALNPVDLKSISIYSSQPKLIKLGLLGKHGVVVVRTKSASWRPPETDLSLLVQGIVKPILNVNLNKHSGPVFRSTLLWNPEGGELQTLWATDDLCSVGVEVFGFHGSEVVYALSGFQISLEKKE